MINVDKSPRRKRNLSLSKVTISSPAKAEVQSEFDWQITNNPDRNSLAWAASVLNRAAGYITGEARPPVSEVERAIEFLTKDQHLNFAEAMFAAKEALPTKKKNQTFAEYSFMFRDLSVFRTDIWWRAVCSGESVCVPLDVTDVFIVDAGGKPGVVIPPEERIDLATLFARSRCRVIQKSTGQTVIPQVTVRGRTIQIEDGSGNSHCHWGTLHRSGYGIAGGWIKRGNSGSGRTDAAAGAAANEPQPNNPQRGR